MAINKERIGIDSRETTGVSFKQQGQINRSSGPMSTDQDKSECIARQPPLNTQINTTDQHL